MPERKPQIKWRPTDEQQLNRSIANYNRKLDRLLKKDPTLADKLPERLRKKDLKERIDNRQDFNRFVKSAQRFTERGAEELVKNPHGLEITKYEKKEIGIKLRIINRHRREELIKVSALEATDRGDSLGYKVAEMGSARLAGLRPKRYTFAKMRKSDFKDFKKSLEKQARANYLADREEDYKKNYLKALSKVLPKEYEYLIAKVKKLPASVVSEIYYSDPNANIDFVYETVAMASKIEVLDRIWTAASVSQDTLQDWEA